MSAMISVTELVRSRRPALPAWTLSACLALVVAVLIVPPFAYLVYGALSKGLPGATRDGLTLDNLRDVFASSSILTPLRNTVVLSATVAVASVAIGTSFAWIVTKTDVRWQHFWINALAIPLYVAPLFLTLAAMALFGRGSYTQSLFSAVGLGTGPDFYSFRGIAAILTVYNAAYSFLYMLGPVGGLDSELEEAAAIAGATRARAMRTIALRMLVPAMLANGVMVFALTAESFTVPALLGGVKFPVLATDIYYDLTFDPVQANRAAAVGLLLLMLTSVGIVLYRRVSGVAARYVGRGGKPHTVKRARLGRWQLPVLVVFTLYLLLAVVLPFATLVLASLQPYIHGESVSAIVHSLSFANYRIAFDKDHLPAFEHTALLACAGAAIMVILGFLIAYAVRYPRTRGGGALEYSATMTVAIPGMALAVGMIWAYVHVRFLYGTLWILLFAYIARWFSQGVRMIGSALLPIGSDMDEAARVAGARLWRRLATILLPIVRRGVLSSFMVLAVFVMNELPVTILLYSSSSQTMSTVIWSAMSTGSATLAAVFAVLAGFVSLVVMVCLYFVVGRERGLDRMRGVAQ